MEIIKKFPSFLFCPLLILYHLIAIMIIIQIVDMRLGSHLVPCTSLNAQKTPEIDEFMLLSASWEIRTRWREIQRFVWKFKTRKSIHDIEFWGFLCTQTCGTTLL